MRLYLVRHGQTAWNVAGRAQGHTDIPLDETGLQQRDHLRRAFDGIRLERIYTSDLQRATQTAEAVVQATGAPLHVRKDLRERSFGSWEGESFLDVQKWSLEESLQQGATPISHRPPGGESYVDLWDRTQPLVESILVDGEDVAVISHGGTCSALMAHLVRGTPDTARAFRFGNTGIYELRRRDDGYFFIVRFNDTSHLIPKSATAAASR